MFERANARTGHAKITINLVVTLRRVLPSHEGRIFGIGLRLRAGVMFAYPDVMVVSGTPQFLDHQQDTLLNPAVIIEVLSQKTERYDRTVKFHHYRALESLRDYVLVASDAVCVEVFTRRADDDWTYAVELTSVGRKLPLTDIYEGVSLDLPA
jgi:Uma2 family endonuclease